jgi:hypothetical protein
MSARLPLAVTALVFATGLGACASRPPVPREIAPTGSFRLEEDLIGRTVGRGEFRTITGNRRGFTAVLNGTMTGDTLTLVEDFTFDDGEVDQKTWRLTRVGPGEWRGTREDVVGEARGFEDGNAFRLEYDIVLPSENGRGTKVRFRDVLVETPAGTVLNRATIGYWGLRVGQVELTITRE